MENCCSLLTTILLPYFLRIEDLKGISKLWILGDNFMAETFRKYVKKASYDLFLKNNFDIMAYCSGKYSDKNVNTLSRLVNSFTQAMNTKFYLPEYLIIFIDDDLIEYLQYKRYNIASLLGPWIEYLCQFIAESLQDRRQQLPLKARQKLPTQVYWVEAVSHSNFDYIDQQAREIFSKCIEANCKIHENMRILKIREFWDKTDDNLVISNKLTKLGISAYWIVDASLQFNIKKREEFLTRNRFKALKSKEDCDRDHGLPKRAVREDQLESDYRDEVSSFFKRQHQQDRYHWKRQKQDGPRYFLPRVHDRLSRS